MLLVKVSVCDTESLLVELVSSSYEETIFQQNPIGQSESKISEPIFETKNSQIIMLFFF